MFLIIHIILIFFPNKIQSTPKYIFSLRNIHHDFRDQLIDMKCSFENEYSRLFTCSYVNFCHMEFDIDISLAPFQYQLNKCGIIIKCIQINQILLKLKLIIYQLVVLFI